MKRAQLQLRIGLMASNPPDWRTEHCARSLCAYKGINPDHLILEPKSLKKGPLGLLFLSEAPRPAWHRFVVEAAKFIAALDRQR